MILIIVWTLSTVLHSHKAERVLLVSFDGFRWDYLNNSHVNNFKWVADHGVWAENGMKNSFKTLTFPNHFTMATGLYQENHGIMGKTFYDRRLKKAFSIKEASKEGIWWQNAEPIWITTTRAGIPSGTLFWVGSEVDYGGVRQVRTLAFNKKMSFRNRIDQVVEWMTKENLRLVTLYINEPDETGHYYGPDSQVVADKVKELDSLLGYLLQKLRDHQLANDTNLILVSDHGLDTVRNCKGVSFRSLLKNSPVKGLHVDENRILHVDSDDAALNIYLKEDSKEKNVLFFTRLKAIVEGYVERHFTVYSREDMPERWHYKGHPDRTPDVMILADPGYYIYYGWGWKYLLLGSVFGGHGYDNKYASMRPFSMMMGPGFKKTPRKIQQWHQVDIYGLICRLLNVPQHLQRPNNGSQERIKLALFGG